MIHLMYHSVNIKWSEIMKAKDIRDGLVSAI